MLLLQKRGIPGREASWKEMKWINSEVKSFSSLKFAQIRNETQIKSTKCKMAKKTNENKYK